MSTFFQSRDWMDRHIDPNTNRVSEEFLAGLNVFLEFACNQESYKEQKTLLCPCARCKNQHQEYVNTVSRHLYQDGFKGNYYVWLNHGESCYDVGESSREQYFTGPEATWDEQGTNFQATNHIYENANVGHDVGSHHIWEDMMETTNEEPYHDNIFQEFEAANKPLYDGCPKRISQLYVASRMLKVKTDYNLAEACVDEISQMFKDVLPKPNKAPASYYETKKLTRALGLPVVKIDVCEDNCMLFWKNDRELMQ